MDNEEWNGNVSINKDILKFTEKVFFGLTLKQLIYSILTIFVTVGAYYLLSKIFSSQIALIISTIIAMPIGAMGFVTYNGMEFFEFVKTVCINYMLPNRIFYKSKSFYNEMVICFKNKKRKGK